MKDPIAIYFIEKIQITLASKETLSLIINSENGYPVASISPNSKNGLPQIQIIEETDEEDLDRVHDLMNSDLKSRKVCVFGNFKYKKLKDLYINLLSKMTMARCMIDFNLKIKFIYNRNYH